MLRIVTMIVVGLSCCACVERRITFTSNVPARVYLDRVDLGETPVEVLFEDYGTRTYVLRADGYQVASGAIELDLPWFEYPIIDFFSQVLWPFVIDDAHPVHVEMKPLEAPQFEGLRERAREYRDKTLRELSRDK